MLKVEANSLEEAYKEASSKLECSITQLHFEIIQHPKPGFLGLFKKTAIIVATCKPKQNSPLKEQNCKKSQQKTKAKVADSNKELQKQKHDTKDKSQPQTKSNYKVHDSEVVNSFYDAEPSSENAVIDEIDQKVKNLFSTICFDLDKIDVSMLDESTVYINIQGNDAALLIGKEGYRYKAISYMLYNWINAKYNLNIRLEVAEFLTSQEKMIANYIKPVIAQIEKSGKGSTKPLDGILVQIALKQLRSRFPDKYVGIKTNSFDEKYIVVNEFRK